ncbi:hypothetical protein Mapa_007758 [Marchantia paleacea]|nr:hypothetical protein Mapa_007758 [Marchantia paleacea]
MRKISSSSAFVCSSYLFLTLFDSPSAGAAATRMRYDSGGSYFPARAPSQQHRLLPPLPVSSSMLMLPLPLLSTPPPSSTFAANTSSSSSAPPLPFPTPSSLSLLSTSLCASPLPHSPLQVFFVSSSSSSSLLLFLLQQLLLALPNRTTLRRSAAAEAAMIVHHPFIITSSSLLLLFLLLFFFSFPLLSTPPLPSKRKGKKNERTKGDRYKNLLTTIQAPPPPDADRVQEQRLSSPRFSSFRIRLIPR